MIGFESLDRPTSNKCARIGTASGDYEEVIASFHDRGIMITDFGSDDRPRSCVRRDGCFADAIISHRQLQPAETMPGTGSTAGSASGVCYGQAGGLTRHYSYGETIFEAKGDERRRAARWTVAARRIFYVGGR